MDTPESELSLEAFALVSAAIGEGDQTLTAVLAAHEIKPETWRKASEQWSLAIASDEALEAIYSEALVRAQDQQKPIPAMTPEQWAALSVEVAAEGRQALSRRGLGPPDLLRLARHWARALGADKALAARYHRAFFAAQRAE